MLFKYVVNSDSLEDIIRIHKVQCVWYLFPYRRFVTNSDLNWNYSTGSTWEKLLKVQLVSRDRRPTIPEETKESNTNSVTCFWKRSKVAEPTWCWRIVSLQENNYKNRSQRNRIITHVSSMSRLYLIHLFTYALTHPVSNSFASVIDSLVCVLHQSLPRFFKIWCVEEFWVVTEYIIPKDPSMCPRVTKKDLIRLKCDVISTRCGIVVKEIFQLLCSINIFRTFRNILHVKFPFTNKEWNNKGQEL